MKKFLILALAMASTSTAANAEHWDVIGVKINNGCSVEKYLQIKDDFNKWGTKHGYQASVLMPLQSNELTTLWWIGKSENAAAFGAAWDAQSPSLLAIAVRS